MNPLHRNPNALAALAQDVGSLEGRLSSVERAVSGDRLERIEEQLQGITDTFNAVLPDIQKAVAFVNDAQEERQRLADELKARVEREERRNEQGKKRTELLIGISSGSFATLIAALATYLAQNGNRIGLVILGAMTTASFLILGLGLVRLRK